MAQDPRFKNENPEASSLGEYLQQYAKQIEQGLSAVSTQELQKAYALLESALVSGARIYVAGNGGSAAIADHLCCDWMKGTHVPHKPALKVQSLVGSVGLLTALANDFGYEDSFSTQVEMLGSAGDVIVLISSSGNSPNILKAAAAARAKGIKVIGLSGFSGGKLKDVADISLYVPINNYGMVEDGHQMIMHVLAQYLAKWRDANK